MYETVRLCADKDIDCVATCHKLCRYRLDDVWDFGSWICVEDRIRAYYDP